MSLSEFSEFDSNFFIPDVPETPLTLEEILMQDEEPLSTVIDEQELSLLGTLDSDFDLSFLQEVASNSSTSLNISAINHIKSQISLSKNEKVNSGNPSCLTSSKSYIAIGTFYGHILVFDSNDKLKWFWKHEVEFGSIAALSITQDEQRLVCGSSKGTVSLWNLTNGEMLKLMDNLHAPFSSIINLKYLSDSNFIILSDTSGSVFILDARKKDFDSSCIFTGSRGEVLSMQPLTIEEGTEYADFSGIENLCIVAMATVSKVIVISVRPNLFVHFSTLLKASPEFLPLLSWNFGFRHRNKNIPLLSVGRQDQLFIYKMDTDFDDRINFIPLFQFKSSSYYLQNIFWIHSDTFLILDTSENIHLIDFLAQEEIETVDISHVELVYESSNYKSLVNGGYVSQAMAKAGEHACANSFSLQRRAPQNRLFILGLNCVYEASLRTWQERSNHLLAIGNAYGALQLIHEKYLMLTERAETDEDDLALDEVVYKLEEAFNAFTSFIIERDCLKCTNEFTLRKIIAILLKYCVCLRSKYEKVFELFETFQENEVAKCTFLECLERFIFNNHFFDLNPILVKEIISYYAEKRWYNLLDSLIIHFSITSLDIDYIIKISLDYYLYDAFIYIHNVAFQDFITPFDRLLEVLNRLIEDKIQYSKEDILLGNKLLVYLNCMLTCAYYPNKGHLPASEEFAHLEKVYSRIHAKDTASKANVLNVLFKYDCTEFLNVILIAFEYLDQRHSDPMKWKQTLIDFFLLKIVEDEKQQFNIEQQNSFFIFFARCLINSDSISINKKYFIKMINSLFSKESKRFEERQQILIQILHERKFEHYYEPSLFLESAQKSQMYKICEFIHRQNQDWTALFFIYTQDPSKEGELFDYIHSLLSQNEMLKSPNEKMSFLKVILNNFMFLVRIDTEKAVNIFVAYFEQSEEMFDIIIGQLSTEPAVLFQFMKLTIFENRVNYSTSLSNSSHSYRKMFDLCRNPRYQEQYIELSCQLEPATILYVLDTLQECNDMNVLNICKRMNVKEGEAYIYEKTKQFKTSFELLLEDFKKTVNETIQVSFNTLTSHVEDQQFGPMDGKFTRLLDFCKRAFKQHSIEEQMKQGFCLSALEFLIETKTTLNNLFKVKNDKLLPQFLHLLADIEKKPQVEQVIIHFNERFKLLFEKLINIMLTHLSLVDLFDFIVHKVLRHHEDLDLYDVREMLQCILENYHYEKSLLELATNMLSGEHHQLMSNFQMANVSSRTVRKSVCSLCGHLTVGNNGLTTGVVIFSCTHMFHQDCLENDSGKTQASQLVCPNCVIKKVEVDESNDIPKDTNADIDSADTEETEANCELTDNILPKFNKLHLNDTQYRALRYFHPHFSSIH